MQVLAKLSSDKYGIIPPIAVAVEEALIETGLELGKVKERISHVIAKPKEKQEGAASIPIPWTSSRVPITSW